MEDTWSFVIIYTKKEHYNPGIYISWDQNTTYCQ